MKEIKFNHPHRQKHFDLFNAFDQPHFNITANVSIENLLSYLKKQGHSVSAGIVYTIARAANEIPEFRWRIRGNTVVEHAAVHPSFTVYTEVADVFSFCTVTYNNHAATFIENARKQSDQMRKTPILEDEADRDDYLFLSAIPWISFTSMQHAMPLKPVDSVPRISWGKFFSQNGTQHMPLSVQAHHAVVDGRHTGQFFEKVQAIANCPENYFE